MSAILLAGDQGAYFGGLRLRTAILLATVTAFGGLLVAAPQPPIQRLDGSAILPRKIDGTVSRLMLAAEVTGAGVAIFNSGKVAYLKSYGFRDKEKKLPLTEDSVMAGASFTKVVFAYLVVQLVDTEAWTSTSLIEAPSPGSSYTQGAGTSPLSG